MADRWISMVKRIGTDVFLRQTAAILAHPNVSHRVHLIQCPTLAIAGAADALLSPVDQFRCLQNRTKFKSIILDSCGHNLIWEKPSVVANIIKKWLELNIEPHASG